MWIDLILWKKKSDAPVWASEGGFIFQTRWIEQEAANGVRQGHFSDIGGSDRLTVSHIWTGPEKPTYLPPDNSEARAVAEELAKREGG